MNGCYHDSVDLRAALPWELRLGKNLFVVRKGSSDASQLEALFLERRLSLQGTRGWIDIRGWITFLLIAKSIGDERHEEDRFVPARRARTGPAKNCSGLEKSEGA